MELELDMSKYLRRVIAPLAIVLMIDVVTTERLAAQSIFESCETDLKTYCSQVTPGNGRILACFYAHEDKISESCDAAIEDQANLLDSFFESMRYVIDQCADDIQKHCAGVAFGGGRVFSCLVEETSPLTESCKKLIQEMSERLSAEDAPSLREGVVRIEGTLTNEGVECSAMRGEGGELYTLAGDFAGPNPGDRVCVEGTVAEFSTCQQGTTIDVERITNGACDR